MFSLIGYASAADELAGFCTFWPSDETLRFVGQLQLTRRRSHTVGHGQAGEYGNFGYSSLSL